MDECLLRTAAGHPEIACDGEACTFWDGLGVAGVTPQPQCAVQYFGLLTDASEELVEWLLGLKQRMEGETSI